MPFGKPETLSINSTPINPLNPPIMIHRVLHALSFVLLLGAPWIIFASIVYGAPSMTWGELFVLSMLGAALTGGLFLMNRITR